MADHTSSTPTSSGPSPWRWEPPTPDELQAVMPGYTIEKLLGRGGMGAVYRGMQVNLQRVVAIKILPPGLEEQDPSFVERFRNEACLMAKLNHPGVVSVHDFGSTSTGLLYFVMEYVDGSDVAKMLQTEGRLLPEHALAITAHVCDALATAHRLGIVHRDIKPANILINSDGQVKVADFGLAKLDDSSSHGLTKTGYAMGTPDYVSPEALMMGSAVDGRADLYAVGVMLYQMLTGNIPRGAYKPATQLRPTLDSQFDVIINKAMQYDREERYQSAQEMRQALDVILTTPQAAIDDAVPVAAIPVANVSQTRSKVAPQRQQRQSRAAFNPATSSGQKNKRVAVIVATLLAVLAVAGAAALYFGTTPEADEMDAVSEQASTTASDEGEANSSWIDLLSRIDLNRHPRIGRWSFNRNGELVCLRTGWALCELPFKYQGECYDIRYTFTRGEGSDVAVYFPFRYKSTGGYVTFDLYNTGFADNLKRAGLEHVTDRRLRDPDDACKLRAQWIPRWKKVTVLIQVREEGLAAHLDDEEIFRWKGDWSTLQQKDGFGDPLFRSLKGRRIFGVGLFSCDAIYHEIKMKVVKGEEAGKLPPAL